MQWFDVDKNGLAKLLERRGKPFIIFELLQNAWDEKSTEVKVTLSRDAGSRYATLMVEDDNPDGFADLKHAFTLFADSQKKTDVKKRGRFNFGEKMVLALCEEARISSTTGSVVFNKSGRRSSKLRRERGSSFVGKIKMTDEEIADCDVAVAKLIPPRGIKTVYNGVELKQRKPVGKIEAVSLQTELADGEGFLRRVTRNTDVEIYEAVGDAGMLYEMGIPVVETGDRWDINIGQKVPLNLDRDNVPPAYLSRVRAAVAERMARELTTEDANSTWVRDAVERYGDKMSDSLINDIARLRYGDKRVSFDPSDPEANALAVTQGYTVVHGPSLSKAEWEAMRRTKAILPAGQVTPSPKPFHPDGKPLKYLPFEKYTPAMKEFCRYAAGIAHKLMKVDLTVQIANDIGWGCAGAYGKGGDLIVNAARLGHDWFGNDIASINDFLIHEFGHEYEGNHLSERYYDALTMLGGKLSKLALEEPELFAGPWMESKLKQMVC